MNEHTTDYDAVEFWAVHEFAEDVDDGSMCMCGVPALDHDRVFPPGVAT